MPYHADLSIGSGLDHPSGSGWPAIASPVLMILTALTLCGCVFEKPDSRSSGDTLKLGLLLPFTGGNAATAGNFERATLMAIDRVNDAGGLRGKKVELLAADTHSSEKASIKSVKGLIDKNVLAILGPEDPEIAEAILPLVNKAGVAFLSPLIGAGFEVEIDCDYPWFRLAPSAQSLGEALAKQMRAEEVESIALLYGAGSYNEAFREAVRDRFAKLGGEVVSDLALPAGASSYAKQLESTLKESADAVVLATAPQMGAVVVNEADVLGKTDIRWYMSPLMKTALFIQNVKAESVEGARGVAPLIFETGEDFPNAFAEAWPDDAPLEGAYFYYDAIGLLSFALESAPDKHLDYETLKESIQAAAAPPGEALTWNDLEDGLERIRDDQNIYYSGLTGPMLLDRCGPRKLGKTGGWKIEDGLIVDDERE